MTPPSNLLIFGASTRAAAFSALRAGMQPWCVDLFADLDLRARCPAMTLPSETYPEGFRDVMGLDLPPGPWMYTGGLENRPALVEALANHRPLWGNPPCVLKQVRNPEMVAALLAARGVPAPAVWSASSGQLPRDGRWVLKPRAGAGGTGIRFWLPGSTAPPDFQRYYLQEYVEGLNCSAIYAAGNDWCWMVGLTLQLVGQPWLGAAPFHYCGSIGPLDVDWQALRNLECLGTSLAHAFELRGVFGVDCVLRDDVPYPVEVNPRYTASVEVLEHATGVPALHLHRRAFDPDCPEARNGRSVGPIVGKAILFARGPVTFPVEGPWMATLRNPGDVWDLPAFADIPAAGTAIRAGRPILTFFTRADSVPACREALQQIAADLDAWLYAS